MSWKTEVKVEGDLNWHGNSLRFTTREEAVLYGHDITNRWRLVVGSRPIESQDPVRHSFVGGVVREVRDAPQA